MPLAAVQFQPQERVGIDAYADRAGGEAGLERGDEALGPFLFVAFAGRCRGAIVIVEVEVAAEDFQRRAVEKARRALRELRCHRRCGAAGEQGKQPERFQGDG